MHETYGKRVTVTYVQATCEGGRMVEREQRCEFVSFARDNRQLHAQAKAVAVRECKKIDRATGNGAAFRYVVGTEVME